MACVSSESIVLMMLSSFAPLRMEVLGELVREGLAFHPGMVVGSDGLKACDGRNDLTWQSLWPGCCACHRCMNSGHYTCDIATNHNHNVIVPHLYSSFR